MELPEYRITRRDLVRDLAYGPRRVFLYGQGEVVFEWYDDGVAVTFFGKHGQFVWSGSTGCSPEEKAIDVIGWARDNARLQEAEEKRITRSIVRARQYDAAQTRRAKSVKI